MSFQNISAKEIAGWIAFLTALFVAWYFAPNDYYLRLGMVGVAYMVAVVPFGLLMGHMGYLSMGQAGFFGLGAYVVGNLTVLRFEQDYWLALAAAIAVTAAVAWLLSFPLFRLRGYHFSIGTLATGQLAYILFLSWPWFTGGNFGTNGVPPPAVAVLCRLFGIGGSIRRCSLLGVQRGEEKCGCCQGQSTNETMLNRIHMVPVDS